MVTIFYHPDCDLRLSRYGILIPIDDNRAAMVAQQFELQYTNIDETPVISESDLLRVHTKRYISALFESEKTLQNEIEKCFELIDSDGNYFRYNPAIATHDYFHLRDTVLRQMGLFYRSSLSALDSGFSYFLGGGMHHAKRDGGHGFCLLNDIVIILKKLQYENKIQSAWVIDIDAHKGDGTAEIAEFDEKITTLSIHMKDGWPFDKGRPSNLDIEMGIDEEDKYLDKLNSGLTWMSDNYNRPDLVIIVNGADPYIEDELPSSNLIKLDKDTMLKRDILVYDFFKTKNIPMSYCMAGGYGKKSWEIYCQFLLFVRESSSERSKISFGGI